MKDIMQLCDIIRETSFSLHKFLKNGHLEKVYDKDNTLLEDFFADLFVENCLIVELKSCKTLINEHTAQLLGYLRASRIEHGLLINFGNPKLQIKKNILSNNK